MDEKFASVLLQVSSRVSHELGRLTGEQRPFLDGELADASGKAKC